MLIIVPDSGQAEQEEMPSHLHVTFKNLILSSLTRSITCDLKDRLNEFHNDRES